MLVAIIKFVSLWVFYAEIKLLKLFINSLLLLERNHLDSVSVDFYSVYIPIIRIACIFCLEKCGIHCHMPCFPCPPALYTLQQREWQGSVWSDKGDHAAAIRWRRRTQAEKTVAAAIEMTRRSARTSQSPWGGGCGRTQSSVSLTYTLYNIYNSVDIPE